MKEIVIIHKDDMGTMNLMLHDLKRILDLNWAISKNEKNHIKILYNNNAISKERYVILNIDIHEKTDLSAYEGYKVITIGYNKKASITVSSVEEDETVFCIQRKIELCEKLIEPQEFVVKHALNNIYAFAIMLLIKEKNFELYF